MVDVEKLTKETIASGGVLALLYFDIHGKNAEVLQELGAGFVQQLLKQDGVIWAIGEVDEPIEQKEICSTSVEVKILTSNFLSLSKICSLYSPISIEILRPNEIKLTLDNVHQLLLDVSTMAFEYKKFIVERISKAEELEQYRITLQQKIDLGKRILNRKKDKENNKEGIV